MSSTGKRRRERIRAKKARLRAEEQQNKEKKSRRIDGHVAAAPGRAARRQRRAKKLSKESFVESLTEDESPFEQTKGRLSLRERRRLRQRERLRREGLDPDRPEERVRQRGMVVPFSWRWLSGTLSILLLVVMYAMVASNVFIVNSVSVGGERYLAPEEVFEISEVAGIHLFWIDARDVEAELESNPSIADAQVFIGWPPDMVSIFVTEREPAIVWEQSNFRVWVDINGTVMFQRQERPDLVRVVDPDAEGIPGSGTKIDREIVAGALQLKEKFPGIEVLLYDDRKGLGHRDERNWIVWFGTGTNMDMKIRVYNEIVRSNYPAIQFREIDVSNHDYPTYTRLNSEQ